jgi:hypothetical protein
MVRMERDHKRIVFAECLMTPKLVIALAKVLLFHLSSKVIHIRHMVDRGQQMLYVTD